MKPKRGGIAITLGCAEGVDLLAELGLWAASDAEPMQTDDIESLTRLVNAGLVVAPSHRRCGLGRQLLDRAEGSLQERGARRLAAIVVHSDDRAVQFWRSTGWFEQSMVLWRRNSNNKHRQRQDDDPSAIDPLKSKEDAETFGIASGVGQAIGEDPMLTGAAALYANAERERRHAEETAGTPHPAGTQAGAPGGERAGDS